MLARWSLPYSDLANQIEFPYCTTAVQHMGVNGMISPILLNSFLYLERWEGGRGRKGGGM